MVDPDGRGWRVDNSGSGRNAVGNTARTVQRCEWDRSELNRNGQTVTRMWIGERAYPDNLATNQRDPDTAGLIQYLHSLYRQGYVNSHGMLPLVHPSQRNTYLNAYGELQAQRYMINQPNPASVRPNGDNIWRRPCKISSLLSEDLYICP